MGGLIAQSAGRDDIICGRSRTARQHLGESIASCVLAAPLVDQLQHLVTPAERVRIFRLRMLPKIADDSCDVGAEGSIEAEKIGDWKMPPVIAIPLGQ
jgi:hypothetical protein